MFPAKLFCERLSFPLELLMFTSRSRRAQLRMRDSVDPNQSAQGRNITQSFDELDGDLNVSFSRDGADIPWPVYSNDRRE